MSSARRPNRRPPRSTAAGCRAESKKKFEEETRRKIETEIAAQKRADEEARRKTDEEAEARRKAVDDARKAVEFVPERSTISARR